MKQSSSILAHFTFCGSPWRWMCPLHYNSFWVKWWTHVSQCYHRSREPICSSFKWLKKWKSTCKYQFLWTSITFLGTNLVHTHCCIPAVHGQCWLQFSQITPVRWIDLELCLDGFSNQSHHVHCVHMILICQYERCNLHDGCQPTLELSAPSP